MSFILYYNAKIYSLKKDKIYNWLLSANGKIVALGTKGLEPEAPVKINLNSQTVIPAFTDAHTHFVMTALYAGRVWLNKADSLNQALKILQGVKPPSGRKVWLFGGGYDKNIWPDGQPHKKYLDVLFPQTPVLIESKDCHAIWVNSVALKLAGINAKTPDPAGGKIGRDASGQPDGLLYEKAQQRVRDIAGQPREAEMVDAVEQAFGRFHSLGITGVHSMEGMGEFRVLQQLWGKGKLHLRFSVYLPQQEAEHLIQAGLQSGFGDEWLRFAGVKFFADGSLGSQTAEMQQPYEGSNNLGLAHFSAEEMKERIALAQNNRLAVAVHAIGDRAVIKVLNALEQTDRNKAAPLLPNRIEHAQLVPPKQIARFRRLGIIASVQPVHIADDVQIAEHYWGKRTAYAYPLRSLLNQKIVLAFGSDTPVAHFDPIQGIYSAVQRKYQFKSTEAVWHPEQAITVAEAVRAYTYGAAVASGEPALKGTLESGKLADFIVLNRDIFTTPLEELLQVKVIRTVLNGQSVFETETKNP